MLRIDKCDFCNKENRNVRILSAPYIACGVDKFPLICDDCKKILDENKVIKDSTGKFSYIRPK